MAVGRHVLVALTAAASVVGCGGAGEPRPERAERRAAARPVVTQPPAPPAEDVRFRASDGRRVSGRYTPAKARRAPAVVLLHEIRGGPDAWDGLVPDLHAAGFAVLAYQSRFSWLERERLPDLVGALRWLRSQPRIDRERVALVGASIGASTTVLAMATRARRTVDAAVALSPPDSSDIWTLQGDGRYRPHDLLLVSDAAEASSAEGMLEGAVRSKAIRSPRPGHGLTLLAEPQVRTALMEWLRERVR